MGNNKWTAYRLTFKLLSPMHIGWRKVGNLQQTRPYVPSRTFWGALTARLARDAGAVRDETLYHKIGKKIEDDLRFSYFYITDQIEMDLSCSSVSNGWPWKEKGNKKDVPGSFDWKYINSFAGSPITEQRVTEEGGLHETEYIMPFTREGKRVCLVGLAFERGKASADIKNWKEAIAHIQLGGERSYGWGKVALAGKIVETNKLFGAALDLGKDDPMIVIPAGGFVTSHVGLDETVNLEGFAGPVEMLAGRLTAQAARHGRNFAPLLPCWAPGTVLAKEKKFSIYSKGIWGKSK